MKEDGSSHFSYENLENIRGANGTLIRSQRVTVIFRGTLSFDDPKIL